MMQNKPIVKESDMTPEMQVEAIDVVCGGIDTNLLENGLNMEGAAKNIKEGLDRKFGPSWHCILGDGYAVDVTMQKKSLLYMFYNGNIAVLIFKS